MNCREAYYYIHQRCNTLYDEQELNEISWRVLEHVTNRTKQDLKFNSDLAIEKEQLDRITQDLLKNRPVQYVLGFEYFGNLKLQVNDSVLIPRPETEELTRILIKSIKENRSSATRILDIGTGSGCIPVLVKNEIPSAEVYALEVSPEALTIAQENARQYKTDIHFIEADILNADLDLKIKFDYIVSNPPYISLSEKINMHTRVLEHEPNLALFVPDDPLIFYRAILLFSGMHLQSKGTIFLELNNLYAEKIKLLFADENFNCEILLDMYGNERFLVAKSNKYLNPLIRLP